MQLPTVASAIAGCWLLLASSYCPAAEASTHAPMHQVARQHFVHNYLQSAASMVTPLMANTTASAANSSMSEAERLVAAAQAESQQRNARILESPRRNTYQFRQGGAAKAVSQLQGGGTVLRASDDSTGVNATVGAAVAEVAEAYARGDGKRNMTVVDGHRPSDHVNLNNNGGNNDDDGLMKRASGYWMESMVQNGASPFAPTGYKVWRNVRDYGAVGDGLHDDTEAINRAISDGNRCGQDCGSSTTLQAVVYFPAGTYLVSRSIVAYYFTQMIGDPTNPPVIKVAPSFVGLGVISSDVYIEGGNGASWYINQNNFYRQVRNFVINMEAAPQRDFIAGIHWQVAQATSLQNIQFIMSTAADNNQQGIFMENGSGGLMNNLEFIGGAMGAYVGNQQFTVRNLYFSGQLKQALQIHWDWGWTWKGVHIENTPVGVIMSSTPSDNTVGSAIFIDSSLSNVGVGWQLGSPADGQSGRATLNLFNVALSNVKTAVQYDNGHTLLAGGVGVQTIAGWGLGKRYDTLNGDAKAGTWQDGAPYDRLPVISPSLLGADGSFLARDKPQYENVPASQFVNLKTEFSAAGDGKTDDTQALNKALRTAADSGRILWIPAGVYLVSDTVTVPPGAKVVGQSWAQIMGAGTSFSDVAHPRPVVRVGHEGDVGSVEIQDLLLTVKGATAGAIVLQWNMHESSPGAAAMWDTHIRVGGAIGSDLRATDCPKLTGKVRSECIAAALLVHITPRASAYFENTWFWVADHDLDTPEQTQIDVFAARGLLIESTGPVWLYGTASEHCVLYQYQTVNAGNIFMGMIQTESPYYQPVPAAPAPFSPSSSSESSAFFPSDPTFDHCNPSASAPNRCAISWAVRVLSSANIYIYGAGLYSWFQEYTQNCVASNDCQDRVFEIDSSSQVWIYSLITKAAVEMISPAGGVSVLGKDNRYSYCDVVMAWMGSAGSDSASGAIHRSPASATVIPFPATTLRPTQTFTLAGPVVSQVDATNNDGYQNAPPGPGRDDCDRCDLARLLTSTCCGVDGGVSNPLEIGAGTPIPRSMFLPAGFVPNQPIPASDGSVYPPGQPLPREILIPIGTTFPIPLLVPPGLPLSNTWSPEADGDYDNGNGTLYLVPDFWDGPRSVWCSYPCTLVFPPITSTTTWTPPVITYKTDKSSASTTIPPYTTELIRISRTTVERRNQPTSTAAHIILPLPHPKPLCFRLPLIRVKICPPKLRPFPPPVPPVTIIPIPPGTKPEPTNKDNKATPEEEEEEKEEDEEEGITCRAVPDSAGGEDDGYDDSYPGAGQDNAPDDYTAPGAGVGTPKTITSTFTGFSRDGTHPPSTTPTTDPPHPTSVNPWPFTYHPADDDYTVLCKSVFTLPIKIGYTLSLCSGSETTIGTPRSTQAPDPTATNGWYMCNNGRSQPDAGMGCPKGSFCSAQPVGNCDDLCDLVLTRCVQGSHGEHVDTTPGVGISVDRWDRGGKSFGDDRDCPSDKANCVKFCNKAKDGPVRKYTGYCGASTYACDASGERIIAVLNIRGSCGPKF